MRPRGIVQAREPGAPIIFARRVFTTAGIWGILVVLPLYFLEARIGRDDPPALTHPEYFYGFVGVTLAWQLVYLAIGRDPERHRPIMLLGFAAKASFGSAVAVLVALGRTSPLVLAGASIDIALAVLFLVAWARTRPPSS
jgi:hypothetical protein